ncbi:MAG: flavin reductase family protein [Pseudomonadota bacterium]
MNDPHRPLKNAFARYSTGVTVVSCLTPEGSPVGITVNSFSSVSLDPPLVLWCLAEESSVAKVFLAADHYAVSVLSADQEAFSNRFATPGHHGINDDEAEVFRTGAPLLKGRIAGFDCQLANRFTVGDHTILIGEVVHFDSQSGKPLIYSGRQYMDGPSISD